nr:MAG TPA: hypothetical protein [Crassvirales sp.]
MCLCAVITRESSSGIFVYNALVINEINRICKHCLLTDAF